jgi:predicted Zn-dependent protease
MWVKEREIILKAFKSEFILCITDNRIFKWSLIVYMKGNRHYNISVIIILIIAIFSGVIPIVSAGLEGTTVDAISFYNKAIDAASNGSTDQALSLINQSLTLQPDFPLALVTKAGLLIDKGKYNDADAIISKLELKEPNDSYVLSTRASLYVNTGKYDEALKAVNKVLVKSPDMIEGWILKGTALGGLGRYQEELNASKEALKIDPNNQKALSNYNYATTMLKENQNNTLQAYVGKKSPHP